MSTVRYSRLPTMDEDVESGFTFDYSSPFTYTDKSNRNKQYKSAFTYENFSDSRQEQSRDDLQFETASRNIIDRVCYYILNAMVFIFFVVTFPVSVWFAVKMVPNYQRLVVFRWGQLLKTKGPGMVFVMPVVDRCHKVDVRMKAFTVPPQQVITGDKAIVEVGADVYYRIADPQMSITNVQNLDKSTRVLLQTSLLNNLVQLPLARVEGQRNAIAQDVLDKCNTTSSTWGIEICRLDISQVKVLQKPPVNQPKPSVIMPPGLAGMGGFGDAAQSLGNGDVPEAFQQLASAFMAAQGYSNTDQQQPPAPDLSTLLATASMEHSAAVPSPLISPLDAAAAGETTGAGGAAAAAAPGVASSSSAVSVGQILRAAQCVLSEKLVRSVGATYQFQLSGQGGSVYHLDLKNGSGSLGEGVWQGLGEVDASLLMTLQDMQLMLCGHLKPFQAYMSGRLKVSGDLSAALRLETFVDSVVKQARRT